MLEWYEHFIIEATALDRFRESHRSHQHHIASKEWSRDPAMLFANMYEITSSQTLFATTIGTCSPPQKFEYREGLT